MSVEEVVYFVASPTRVKVGYSSGFAARLNQLRRGSFDELEVLGKIAAGREIEAAIHYRLKPHNIKGEWYHRNSEVMGLIESLLNGDCRLILGIPATTRLAKDEDTRIAVALRLVKLAAIVVSEDLVTYLNKYRDKRAFTLGASIGTALTAAMQASEAATTQEELAEIHDRLSAEVQKAQLRFAVLLKTKPPQVFFPEHAVWIAPEITEKGE